RKIRFPKGCGWLDDFQTRRRHSTNDCLGYSLYFDCRCIGRFSGACFFLGCITNCGYGWFYFESNQVPALTRLKTVKRHNSKSVCSWELLYKGWFTLPTTLHRLTVHLWQK